VQKLALPKIRINLHKDKTIKISPFSKSSLLKYCDCYQNFVYMHHFFQIALSINVPKNNWDL
jgi:hypothetical protein